MKIKILFFPIALIVCVFLSIGYIYPEFSGIKEKNERLKKEKEILDNITERAQNIASLTGNLDSNPAKENLVRGYLPLSKYEEEIINKVYKIASDSMVSLVNINISAEDSKKGNIQTQNSADSDVSEEIGKPQVKLKNISAAVEILGTYENIRTFLSRIYSMEKFNNITSLDISKDAGGSANLIAKADVEYGYFAPVSVSKEYNLNVFTQREFDFSAVSMLENLIAKKIPDIESGASGKNNPFIPN